MLCEKNSVSECNDYNSDEVHASDGLNPQEPLSPIGGVITPSEKAWRLLGDELGRYAEDMMNRDLCEETVKDVPWALVDMYSALRASGLGIKR